LRCKFDSELKPNVMNYKAKSFLYFSGLVLAVAMYYNTAYVNTAQNTELAQNSIENVSITDTLK